MRDSIDVYFLQMAELVASRSTCLHRHQGVVLVKDKRVISTGYNGSPPGLQHCSDIQDCAKTHNGTCRAEGLHGESNAIAAAAKLGICTNGTIVYSVFSPCAACCNLMASAGVLKVVYKDLYENYTNGPFHLSTLGIEHKRGG